MQADDNNVAMFLLALNRNQTIRALEKQNFVSIITSATLLSKVDM